MKNAFNVERLQQQHDRLTELYSKFSPEFEEKVRTNAEASKVFDCLLHGVDVYTLLEAIIDNNKIALDKIIELTNSLPPRVSINEIYEKVRNMAINTKPQNTETAEEFNTRVFGNKKHGDDSRK